MTCTRRFLLKSAIAAATIAAPNGEVIAEASDATISAAISKWRDLTSDADTLVQTYSRIEGEAWELLGDRRERAVVARNCAATKLRLLTTLAKATPGAECPGADEAIVSAAEELTHATKEAQAAEADEEAIRLRLGVEEAQRHAEDAGAAAYDAFEAVMATKARTIRGLKLKLEVFAEVMSPSAVDLQELIAIIFRDLDTIASTAT